MDKGILGDEYIVHRPCIDAYRSGVTRRQPELDHRARIIGRLVVFIVREGDTGENVMRCQGQQSTRHGCLFRSVSAHGRGSLTCALDTYIGRDNESIALLAAA